MTPPRHIQSLLDELGLELLSCRRRRHYVLYLRNGHGITGTVTICNTPSDARSQKNARADLRRLARLTTPCLSGTNPGKEDT